MLYAGPTFHDEVASAAACMLHDLGFYVVVYIGNGVHIAGMMVPFSGTLHQLIFSCNYVNLKYLFQFLFCLMS